MSYYLKRFLLFFLQVVIVIAIIVFAAYKIEEKSGRLQNNQVQQEQKFPELSGPITKTYAWEYGGKKYELSQKLYQSSYQFYQNSPKAYSYNGELPKNWQEDYYGMFLQKNSKDTAVPSLAQNIKKIGEEHNLNSDKIAELVLAFVQAIPYDDAKAEVISSTGKDATVRYPYETLYEKAGVCSEKSLLAVSLLRELGYGSALFVYEQDNHMAIGIQCPQKYSTYDSGYCFAQTTTVGHKIGILPEIDPAKSRAVEMRELGSFESESASGSSKELGNADIYQKTVAGEYRGIIATIKTNQEIQQLQKDIASLKTRLAKAQKDIKDLEDELEGMRKDMKKYENRGDIEAYNKLVNPYNKKVKENENLVESYNSLVNQYNSKVTRYNTLIKS